MDLKCGNCGFIGRSNICRECGSVIPIDHSKLEPEFVDDDPRDLDFDLDALVGDYFPNEQSMTAEPTGLLDPIILSDDEDDDDLQLPPLSKESTGDPGLDYIERVEQIPMISDEEIIELFQYVEAGLWADRLYGDMGSKLRVSTEGNEVKCTECKLTAERFAQFTIQNDGQNQNYVICIDCLEEMIKFGNSKKEALVYFNLHLVVEIAKGQVGQGVLFLDLIDIGILGLVRAIEKFDYKSGSKFASEAKVTIRKFIRKEIEESSQTILLPKHTVDVINKLAKVQRDLLAGNFVPPSPEQLSDELGMPLEEVLEVQKITQRFLDDSDSSLSHPLGPEGDSEFGDLIEDSEAIVPGDAVAFKLLQDELSNLLDSLSDREAGVIRMRFGLTDGQPKTLDEISLVFGITRERIRQIESKTISKLRNPSKSQSLRDYLD